MQYKNEEIGVQIRFKVNYNKCSKYALNLFRICAAEMHR